MNRSDKHVDGNLTINLTWNLYMQLLIGITSLLSNLINLAVFLSPKLKDNIYMYMLVNSIVNIIYLSIGIPAIFFSFCTTCPLSMTYASQIAMIWLVLYMSNSLKFMHVLLQIVISARIYLILMNKQIDWLRPWMVIATCAVVSVVCFIPEPFLFEVAEMSDGRDTIFTTLPTNFGNSTIGEVILIVQFGARAFLAVLILGLINVLNLVEFRKRFKIRSVSNASLPNSGNFRYLINLQYMHY